MANSHKPNILVIWGDDIGITNLSCYSDGMMGYRTPNIDRIAKEGMRFTDSYGEQSCTAGRAAFITGQCGFRTGMTKVGIPGATMGLSARRRHHGRAASRTRATPRASSARTTSAIATSFLPTVHGFDEFFGNLYHLNAEEEPELPDYPPPKDFPNFKKNFGPRGVLRCHATDKDDKTVDRASARSAADDRGHRAAQQEAHGDLRRRVRRSAAKDFIQRQHEAESRSSAGSTPRTCTSARTRSPRASGRPGAGSRRTTTR